MVIVACTFDASGGGSVDAHGETGASTSGSTQTAGASTRSTHDSDTGAHEASTTQAPPATRGDDDDTTRGDTQEPQVLDDAAVIVRYYLDEADEGTAPTEALDATAVPLHLAHDWQPGVAYDLGEGENRGLRWDAVQLHGGPHARVMGTKVRTALEGKTAATIEFVAEVTDTATDGGSRFVAIGHDLADVRLGLLTEDPGEVWFRWRNGQNAAYWDLDLPSLGRAVFHVVLETTAAEDDRVRLYVDGERVPISAAPDWPSHGDAIDFHDDSELTIGNRPPPVGTRSLQGIIHYAALYAEAFDEGRIESHALVLARSDDHP